MYSYQPSYNNFIQCIHYIECKQTSINDVSFFVKINFYFLSFNHSFIHSYHHSFNHSFIHLLSFGICALTLCMSTSSLQSHLFLVAKINFFSCARNPRKPEFSPNFAKKGPFSAWSRAARHLFLTDFKVILFEIFSDFLRNFCAKNF